MPTAGYFLPSAAESNQRTPPKPMVLESFRAWNASRVDTRLPRVPTARSHALLSHRLRAAIRWPLTRTRAALAYQGCPLRLPRRRRTHCTSCHVPCRGRCPHRPAVYGTPYSVAIAKPVRTLASQSAPSSHPAILPRNNFPLPPPRKGLTGAFFWHTINML